MQQLAVSGMPRAIRSFSTCGLQSSTRSTKRFALRSEQLEVRLPLVGDFVSAMTLGGTGLDHVIDIQVDAEGNQYLAGEFHNTVDFDPGLGQTLLTSSGGSDAFVAKFDSANNLLWAKGFGGPNDDRLNSLAVSNSGEVYLGGNFTGTTDFDPAAAVHEVTSNGSRDAYLLALSNTGEFAWAATFGDRGGDELNDIAFADGQLFVTGTFVGTVDFDPDLGETPLTSQGSLDTFIAKYTSAGQLIWANSIGGANQDVGQRLAVSATDNIVVAGQFGGTADFDPAAASFPLTTAGGFDLFVSSYDSNGNFQWAVRAGADGSDTITDLALDSVGNVIATGGFFDTVDFDPGPGSQSAYAGDNSGAYVWKLSSLGEFEWVQAFRGSINDSALGLAVTVSPTDQVFATGTLFGRIGFAGTFVTTLGANDPYVVKLDNQSGSLEYVRRFGGIYEDIPFAIATDASGHVLVGGFFLTQADFDPGESTHFLESAGGGDAFLLRLFDEAPPSGGSVVGRHVFYNNSAFDGSNPAASATDDNAIATDKSVLLPGQTASFANYTSYSRGVNGVMIDIAGLANADELSADDFIFRRGNSHEISSWTAAPQPIQVEVRTGAGLNGSDRVTLVFADRAILESWLEVTVRSTHRTGLPAADTFYIGNSIGEAGNADNTVVDASDFAATRSNVRSFLSPASLTNAVDFNRDALVNAADLLIVRDHTKSLANALKLITPGASAFKQSDSADKHALVDAFFAEWDSFE